MADAMTTWQNQALDALTVANNLLDRMGPMLRVYAANALEKVIGETKDGEIVPGTRMTKERVIELIMTFDAFNNWLNTPPAEGALPPVLVIGKVD